MANIFSFAYFSRNAPEFTTCWYVKLWFKMWFLRFVCWKPCGCLKVLEQEESYSIIQLSEPPLMASPETVKECDVILLLGVEWLLSLQLHPGL